MSPLTHTDRHRRLTVALSLTLALLVLIAAVAFFTLTRAHGPARPHAQPSTLASTQEPDQTSDPTPRPLEGLRVLLDPGHAGQTVDGTRQVPDGRGGMKDCNTTGTATVAGYPEHTFNWEVATRLRDLLTAEGAAVTLTRNDDTTMGPCVDERGAMTANADVTISIHANGTTDRRVRGYFALVSSPPLNEVQGEPSLTLARHLLDALASAGFTPSTTFPDQIMYTPHMAGLNFATSPAVIMELGEMRNPDDAALLSSPQGQDRYAHALKEGLAAWASQRTR